MGQSWLLSRAVTGEPPAPVQWVRGRELDSCGGR